MKIGIIGLGFVGLTFASVLASKGYNITGVDYDITKIEKIRNGKAPFFEPKLDETLKIALKKKFDVSTSIQSIKNCDLIFVTVGTPTIKDGSIDLSMVESAINEIGDIIKETNSKPTIIIKSTVVPGTTHKLVDRLEKKSMKRDGIDFSVITNPEFLREGVAVDDTINPHVIVLGGKENKFMKVAENFYSKLQPKVKIVKTNPQTAEVIKYANNSFLATKISFINQIANICEVIPGANIDIVSETIGLDPRVGKLFLNAGAGYGGSCLPKDVKAIINFSEKIGIKSKLLNAVEEVNHDQVKNIISIMKKSLKNIKNRKIAILGLAFKPDTDDIRESVSLKLIDILLKEQAKVMVHDPKAIENTKKIFRNKIEYSEDLGKVIKDSYCVIIMTSWNQYAEIDNSNLRHMKNRIVIDTRRILLDKKLDIEYHAIGIG